MAPCVKPICKSALKKVHKGDIHKIHALAHVDRIIAEVRNLVRDKFLVDRDIILSTDSRNYQDCTVHLTGLILDDTIRVLVFEEDHMPSVLQVTVRFYNTFILSKLWTLPTLRDVSHIRCKLAWPRAKELSCLSHLHLISQENQKMASSKATVVEIEKGMADIMEREEEVLKEEETEDSSIESGVENFAYIDEEVPLADDVSIDIEKDFAEVMEEGAEASKKAEKKKADDEAESEGSGLDNIDEAPLADQEICHILNNATLPTKRIVSFKPETSVRIIVPNGPLPDKDIVEVVPRRSSIAFNEEDMEEINISDIEPQPAANNHGFMCKQKRAKSVFFSKRKHEIDLVNGQQGLAQGAQPRLVTFVMCSQEKNKWVQCGCIVLIILIILLLIFVKDGQRK